VQPDLDSLSLSCQRARRQSHRTNLSTQSASAQWQREFEEAHPTLSSGARLPGEVSQVQTRYPARAGPQVLNADGAVGIARVHFEKR